MNVAMLSGALLLETPSERAIHCGTQPREARPLQCTQAGSTRTACMLALVICAGACTCATHTRQRNPVISGSERHGSHCAGMRNASGASS